MDDFDYLIKITIIGNSNVGKSSIIKRIIYDQFDIESKSTIGIDFHSKIYKKDDTILKVQFWDTAGQERYRSITSNFYRNAKGIIFTYDISDMSSFIAINQWLKNVQENISSNIYFLLIGNKSDKIHNRAVDYQIARDFAEKNKMMFLEVSAMSNSNINTACELLLEKIYYEIKLENKPSFVRVRNLEPKVNPIIDTKSNIKINLNQNPNQNQNQNQKLKKSNKNCC